MTTAARRLCWSLLAVGAALQVRVFWAAGPLWRDEAEHLGRALLPWPQFVDSFAYAPVPVLPTLALKSWAAFWGDSDLALRGLGLLLGLANLGAVAWASRSRASRPSALALALWILAPAAVSETAGLKGYGWGSLSAAVVCGLIWKGRPTPKTALAAGLAALASVQCLYSNVFTIGAVSALTAGFRLLRRDRGASVPVAAACGAAVSLAPYAFIIGRFAQWKAGLGELFGWDAVWRVLASALPPGGEPWALPWAALILSSLAFVLVSGSREKGEKACAVAGALLALGTQALFVKASSFFPYERYFLAVLPPLALAAAWALEDAPPWAHVLPLALLLYAAAPAWSRAGARQTNMDLVAARLERADRRDLIVLGRWYYYSSFGRYYRGQAPWVTVPFIEPKPYYTNNLFKDWMAGPDPVEPTLAAIRAAWRRGGSVWLVGQPPSFLIEKDPRRPSEPDIRAHSIYWEKRLFGLLGSRGPGREVGLPDPGPVNRLERPRLAVWVPAPRT